MKRLSIALLILAVAGCDEFGDPRIALCKSVVERTVKSPASIKWVKETTLSDDKAKGDVLLEFDAANDFGALLRSPASCVIDADETWGMKVSSANVAGVMIEQTTLTLVTMDHAR